MTLNHHEKSLEKHDQHRQNAAFESIEETLLSSPSTSSVADFEQRRNTIKQLVLTCPSVLRCYQPSTKSRMQTVLNGAMMAGEPMEFIEWLVCMGGLQSKIVNETDYTVLQVAAIHARTIAILFFLLSILDDNSKCIYRVFHEDDNTFLHYAAMNRAIHRGVDLSLGTLLPTFQMDYSARNRAGKYMDDLLLPDHYFKQALKQIREKRVTPATKIRASRREKTFGLPLCFAALFCCFKKKFFFFF